jgi:hypothetical protein
MRTTYFAKVKNLSLEDQRHVISISRSVPNGFPGSKYFELAPEWAAVQAYKANGDFERFAGYYRAMVLADLDAQEIYDQLGEDAILVCWERDRDTCHRSLVAEWFADQLDVVMQEI